MEEKVHAKAKRAYEDFDPICKWYKQEVHVTFEIYLPGFKSDQIKIKINHLGFLEITGEHPLDEHHKWRRFTKEVKIPRHCDPNAIYAKFMDSSILSIVMPKKISPIPTHDQEYETHESEYDDVDVDDDDDDDDFKDVHDQTEVTEAQEFTETHMGPMEHIDNRVHENVSDVMAPPYQKFGVKEKGIGIKQQEENGETDLRLMSLVVVLMAIGFYVTFKYREIIESYHH